MKLSELLLTIIYLSYILAAIVSFGHSVHKAAKGGDTALIPILNTSTIGAFWPLYASYLIFEEKDND